MCRSIKVLRRPEEPATAEEVEQAARQFVRKISGMQKPSRANQEAFDRAIREVAAASQALLKAVSKTNWPPMNADERPPMNADERR